MGRAKITYVQLANKRTVEVKLHEDGALSIAQVQDGDFIRIPGEFVDAFTDAIATITASSIQASIQQLNQQQGINMNTTAQYPRCHKCNTIKTPNVSWWSCDGCGVVTCIDMDCSDDHFNGANHQVTWSVFA